MSDNKFHGVVLEYRDDLSVDDKKKFMVSLPARTDFILRTEHEPLIKDIREGSPILFLPNDVIDSHHKEDTRLEYKPILIGVLRDGSKAALVLTGVDVSFEVQVPDDADIWSFTSAIKEVLKDQKIYPKDVTHTSHFPGKIFHERQVEYVKISFNTLFQRKKAITALKTDTVVISYKRLAKFGGVGFLNKPGGPSVQTARDDMSCYYRKFAREYRIKLAGWNWVRSYNIVRDDNKYVRRACVPYCFEVDIKNLWDIEASRSDALRPSDVPIIDLNVTKDLLRDKSLECGWDLETTSRHSNGNAPDPLRVFGPDGKEEDTIFLDSMVFRWHWSKETLVRVAISVIPTPPLSSCMVIKCNHQSELIKIKALILERMCPEILGAFNDGFYDWPFVLRRAEKYSCIIAGNKYPLTDFMKMHMSSIPYDPASEDSKYRVRGEYIEKLKLEAGGIDYEPTVFAYPGTIVIDIRGVLMQMYPKADKSSLNYFLSLNNLKSKEDMPYLVMFKAVKLMRLLETKIASDKFSDHMKWLENCALECGDTHKLCSSNSAPNQIELDPTESNYGLERLTVRDAIKLIGGPAYGGKISEGASMIINYCNEDAEKCPELMLIRNIIPDKRAMANIAYTSMFDSLYRAGGIKVCNLVMTHAMDWNLAFSNIGSGKKDGRKYPGAYVVSPKKGLYRDHKIVKRARRQKTKTHDSLSFSFQSSEVGKDMSSFKKRTDPTSPEFDKDLLDDSKHTTAVTVVDENDTTDRPCTGLDFSSLYPSLIMAYNLSPEKVVTDREERDRLTKLGYDLIEVNFKYGLKDQPDSTKEDILAWVVQHKHPARAIIADEVTRARSLSKDSEEHGWFKFMRKEVIESAQKSFKATTLEQWKEYGMGIYPYILKGLFDRRSGVKKLMEHYAEPREFLDKIFKEYSAANFAKLPVLDQKSKLAEFIAKEHDVRKQEYAKTGKDFHKWRVVAIENIEKFFQKSWTTESLDELFIDMVFSVTYYNTIQLVLKVLMNTFYGVAGNQLSPLFLVAVAGGVTLYGRKNLKMVKSFVESESFGVLYGDTDSLYITCPEHKFAATDKLYVEGAISKLQYWTKQIEITMETMDEFKLEVNKYLMLNNMSPFLTMAYEEALWPYGKFGKKKYIGVQHQNIVNLACCMPGCSLEDFMASKSLMIRGLQIVTRGASNFLKLVCYDIFRQAFAIDEVRTLKEIIEDKLQEITKTKWDPNVFAKSAKYKLPGINPETGERKQGNVSVLRFVDRMAAIERTNPEYGIKAPDVGERFKYIIAKRYPWKYDVRGNQVDISMADKYEYLDSLDNTAYSKSVGGLEFDLDYYVTGEAIGQFARFIIYHPDYDQYSKPDMTDEEYETVDKAAWAYAKKTLIQFYETHYGTKYAKKGKVHKAVFKGVNQRVLSKLGDVYGAAGQLFIVSNTIATKAISSSSPSRREGDGGEDEIVEDLGTINDVVNRFVTEAKKLGTKWAVPLPLQPLIKGGKGGDALHKWMRTLGMDPFIMQVTCVTGNGSYYRTRREQLELTERKLLTSVKTLVPSFQLVYQDNIQIMIDLVERVVAANELTQLSINPVDDPVELDITPDFDVLATSVEDTIENASNDIVFELYDNWIELIAVYKQLAELDAFKNSLRDMRSVSVDKNAMPVGLQPRRGRSTKDEFLEWLARTPMTSDSKF